MTLQILPVVAVILGLILYYPDKLGGKTNAVGLKLFFAGVLAFLFSGAHSISIH